jgi:hypothetical protein
MQRHSPKYRRFSGPKRYLSTLLVVAIFNFGAFGPHSVLAAVKKDDAQMAGQLIVTGNVTINEKKAINGTTIFSSSKIAVACSKGNSAIVNLGRLGRVELSPGSKMMLKFTNGFISGDLLEGKAVVSTPVGVKVSINTPDGVMNADGKEATVTPVTSQRGVRCVPAVVSSSGGSVSALSPGAMAAMLVGAGGSAAAAAAIAKGSNKNSASGIIP